MKEDSVSPAAAAAAAASAAPTSDSADGTAAGNAGTAEMTVHGSRIRYVNYETERQLPLIRELIDRDLSEPYSILTYRYFVNNWPKLTIIV